MLTTGASATDRRYYAFGRQRAANGTSPSEYAYTGQQDGTGLYYYNARYYDPQMGTFISPDSIVPDPSNPFAYNRYIYSLGNPVNFNDPSGHGTCSVGSVDVIHVDVGDCMGGLLLAAAVAAVAVGGIAVADGGPDIALTSPKLEPLIFPMSTPDVSSSVPGITASPFDPSQEYFPMPEPVSPFPPFSLDTGDSNAFFLAYRAGDIVPYGTNLPSGSNLQKHHAVIDIWARANISGYNSRQAPAVVLTTSQHDETRIVFNQWRLSKTGSVTGQIDWTQVSPQEIYQLSEQMLDAAQVSDEVRQNYYQEFNKYIYEGE